MLAAWLAVAGSAPPARASDFPSTARGPAVSPAPSAETPSGSDQAEIASAPAPERGRFAALWVTPLGTHRFQGAGLEAGYRYGWLAVLVREGFAQNGYQPVSGTALLALERTQRFSFDLEVDVQRRFGGQVALAVGGGAGFTDDDVDITTMNGLAWTSVSDHRRRIRPLLGVTLAGPIFEAGLTGYLGSDVELRFSLGVCWGRL